MDAKEIRTEALAELEKEAKREAIDLEKDRIRSWMRRSLWDRVLPFKITITRKDG